MKRRFWFGLLVLASALPGCFPEKRVVWSPDGRVAAVIGGDGLYLCGPDGRLSPRIVEDAVRVAWWPDSRQLLVVRKHAVSTWQNMLPFLSEAQRARIVEVGERIHIQALAFAGKSDDFEPQGLDELTDGEKAATLVYLRSLDDPRLAEKFGEKWTELEKAAVDAWSLQAVSVDRGRGQPGAVLFRTPNEIREPRVAPTGQAVACITSAADGKSGALQLLAVPIDGGAPRAVAEHVAMFADWSADGRYLVYAHANGLVEKDAVALGAIARRAVADEAGRLLETFTDAEDLAGLLYQDETRVRCLKDGRILFSAVEVQLPATTGDLPQRGSLFVIDPGRQPVVARLMTRRADAEVADRIFLFDISPDEAHVCIPGNKGDVSLLTLATSKVWTPIQAFETPGGPPMAPAWRSADELACPVLDAGQRWQVALLKLNWDERSLDKTILSTNWPPEAASFLLPDEKGAAPEGAQP